MNRSISHILNYFHLRFFLLVILLSNTLASFAQLTGIKNIPGDYVDLASAISDLNASGVGSGGVTLNLLPGNPQISIAGGYVISAEGSISDNIIIQGNGNVITAFTPQTIGNINDAIFKLIGGDWIIILSDIDPSAEITYPPAILICGLPGSKFKVTPPEPTPEAFKSLIAEARST